MTIEIDVNDLSTLAHHGVLGQKWGVTRDKAASGNKRAIKKLAKGDQEWSKELAGTKGFITVHNALADKMNNGLIDEFNKTHHSSGDLNDGSPATKKYLSDYEKLYTKTFTDVVHETYGESPSGKFRATVGTDANGPFVKIVHNEVVHATDISNWTVRLKASNGQITGVGSASDNSLKHDLDLSDENTLAHYGVLGQRWGRHLPGRTEESHNPKPGLDASDDHVRAHVLDKKPVRALSNTELQTVNQRLQLEQQYSKLKSNTGAQAKIKKGNDSIKTLLAVGTSATGLYALGKTTSAFLKSEQGQKLLARGAKSIGKLLGKW